MNEPSDKTTGAKERLAAQAKTLFDDSVERLDGASLSRLNQGRHRALAELDKAPGRALWLRWAPATGIAAMALVAVLVMRGPGMGELPVEEAMATDFELLLEAEDLEMLEELEFYSWMELAELEANGNVG